jgi:hypothetical protein
MFGCSIAGAENETALPVWRAVTLGAGSAASYLDGRLYTYAWACAQLYHRILIHAQIYFQTRRFTSIWRPSLKNRISPAMFVASIRHAFAGAHGLT